MKELLFAALLTIGIFGVAYYQSYRDKLRWKRINSGAGLSGMRQDVPPLVLDGLTFDSHDRRVLVIWGGNKRACFDSVYDAKQRIKLDDAQAGKTRAKSARIFSWDGKDWTPRN